MPAATGTVNSNDGCINKKANNQWVRYICTVHAHQCADLGQATGSTLEMRSGSTKVNITQSLDRSKTNGRSHRLHPAENFVSVDAIEDTNLICDEILEPIYLHRCRSSV